MVVTFPRSFIVDEPSHAHRLPLPRLQAIVFWLRSSDLLSVEVMSPFAEIKVAWEVVHFYFLTTRCASTTSLCNDIRED